MRTVFRVLHGLHLALQLGALGLLRLARAPDEVELRQQRRQTLAHLAQSPERVGRIREGGRHGPGAGLAQWR